MTKTIDTLVEDIQNLLDKGIDSLPQEAVEAFGKRTGETLSRSFIREDGPRTLRMSSIGKPCLRQLWFEHHLPEQKEALSADSRLKFLYGDLTEEFILFLAELAGHRVEARQHETEIASIKGHWDGIIDGCIVDVKSASSYSFQKFKSHLSPDNDPFGYTTQLQSYLHAGQSNDLVVDKSRGAFLVIDKTLGHICLDIHPYVPFDWESEYEKRKAIVYDGKMPERGFKPVPDGKSGNLKLPVNCSYCPFKQACHPGLRTFLYYNGPVFLTKVVRTPNVPEVSE